MKNFNDILNSYNEQKTCNAGFDMLRLKNASILKSKIDLTCACEKLQAHKTIKELQAKNMLKFMAVGCNVYMVYKPYEPVEGKKNCTTGMLVNTITKSIFKGGMGVQFTDLNKCIRENRMPYAVNKKDIMRLYAMTQKKFTHAVVIGYDIIPNEIIEKNTHNELKPLLTMSEKRLKY